MLWNDKSFSKERIPKKYFWECHSIATSNWGIWSIAQRRVPNLSYASKRERANLAFNIKVKLGTANKEDPHLFVPPGGTRVWPQNNLLVFAAKNQIKKKSKLKNQCFYFNKCNFPKKWKNSKLKISFWKTTLKIKLCKMFFSIEFGDRPVRWSLARTLAQKAEIVIKFIAHVDFSIWPIFKKQFWKKRSILDNIYFGKIQCWKYQFRRIHCLPIHFLKNPRWRNPIGKSNNWKSNSKQTTTATTTDFERTSKMF